MTSMKEKLKSIETGGLVRSMRLQLCFWFFLLLTTLRCEPSGNKSAASSRREFAIVTVTVELSMSVEVTDADTGAPISGATAELVRSGDGKKLAPHKARNRAQRATTNDRGVAHFEAAFGGHLAVGGWVDVFTGNSFVAVKAPKYIASRASVSIPSGRLETSVQYLDRLTFQGDETRRKVSYHVTLHRIPNA